MTIILSGGWGYGNLGDDAILISSIHLLQEKYSNCKIIILSYNAQETKSVVKDINDVFVENSLHVSLFGLKKKEFSCGKNFFQDIWQLIKDVYQRKKNNLCKNRQTGHFLKNREHFYNKHAATIRYFINLCKNADMYIMSGGGYLTTWSEMHISKYCEIDIAKKCKLKTYIIGQTIGPFKGNSKIIACKILELSDGTFFRDRESINDTKSLGFSCYDKVVPDLALCNNYQKSKGNFIVFIPFTVDLIEYKKTIVDNFDKIYKDTSCDIYITVSQQWPLSIKLAMNYYFSLKNIGIDVKIIIPQNYQELIDIVASAQMTFSQNLHGLILSYCSHTPIVSLNKRRKFVSFMESIGQYNNMFAPKDLTKDSLYNCFKHRGEYSFDRLDSFRDQIHEAINNILK